MTRRVGVTLLVGLLAAVAAACGGGDTSSESRPLSDAEAGRLAQAGYGNLLAGGARFEANSAFLGTDPLQTVTLVGEIDWEGHVGRALVRGGGPDETLTEVYWEEGVVIERRPAFDAIIAGMGGPTTPWIARAPEPSTRQLDRLLSVVFGLALEQPDNALLLQQTEGSAFIRADELRSEPVEVLRYGTRNLYWLAADDGAMLRFEGNSAGGTAPTVVDLVVLGPVEVPSPDPDQVIPVEAVAEIYSAAIGG